MESPFDAAASIEGDLIWQAGYSIQPSIHPSHKCFKAARELAAWGVTDAQQTHSVQQGEFAEVSPVVSTRSRGVKIADSQGLQGLLVGLFQVGRGRAGEG